MLSLPAIVCYNWFDMITTVIFDMDDTLYDEVDYCASGFRAVAGYLAETFAADKDAAFEALWGEFSAGNHRETFNCALDKLGIAYEIDDINRLVELYRNHKPDISLPSESKQILDQLNKDYSLALLTDGFLPAQKLKVDALGIEHYFKHIVYTEELGRQFWKPNPKGFEMILEKLSAKAENTVYIADNAKKDFIGPNSLGMDTIQLKRANKVHLSDAPDENGMPNSIIDSIILLPSLLEIT